MTHPPPRKRFQIHLSTAIVMMFVAGALIWANVGVKFVHDNHHVDIICYGWPLCVCSVDLTYKRLGLSPYMYWDIVNLVFNMLANLAILFAVWFLCEWLIRRRAARKGA